jgi:hypothetical protein
VGIVAALAVLLLPAAAVRAQPTVFATVTGSPVGQPMGPGFVGVSLEYKALHVYTGRDPQAVNPVLVALLRALAPGQAPVLRIGGDSTDATWWPVRGAIAPEGVSYALTSDWLRIAHALAQSLGARMIMGVNLAAGRPDLAAAEARAILAGVGRAYVQALEIGNEPDLYGVFSWYKNRRGRAVHARSRGYDMQAFTHEFSRWRAALPSVPLAGPAVSAPNWMSGLGGFLAAEPGLSIVTYHRYPLLACDTDPTSTSFPSIPNLLSDASSIGLAQAVAPYAALAHARGLTFRIGEMNSAACRGRAEVSDTFASALWMLDTLFSFASVGVDGVNVHTLPGAAYELFTFSHTSGGWQAFVHPEYYAMLLFAQAFPPGAQLLQTSTPGGPLKVWATRAADGTIRVVLINKDPANSQEVQLQVPGAASGATLEQLQAPSVTATSGVTLGGQSFGDQTTTGLLPGSPQLLPEFPFLGSYSITVPAGSAVLLTQ